LKLPTNSLFVVSTLMTEGEVHLLQQLGHGPVADLDAHGSQLDGKGAVGLANVPVTEDNLWFVIAGTHTIEVSGFGNDYISALPYSAQNPSPISTKAAQ